MRTPRIARHRVTAVASLLAVPGLVLSQTAPLSGVAALLWSASGVCLAVALVSAVIASRDSRGRGS